MKLSISVTVSATFVHKSGEKFNVDNAVRQEYDKGSEEYETLAEGLEEATGVKKAETTEEEFVKNMGMYVANEIRKMIKERIDHTCKCAKEVYLGRAEHGIVEFGGWIFNMKEFSAVAFGETKVSVSYK